LEQNIHAQTIVKSYFKALDEISKMIEDVAEDIDLENDE